MKTALVLDLLLVILFVVVVWSLPIGASQSAAFFPTVVLGVLYLLLFYFELKAKGLAYLGSSVLSFALILYVMPIVPSPGVTLSSKQIRDITLSMILLSLNSLEGFKSYLQSRGPSNMERR